MEKSRPFAVAALVVLLVVVSFYGIKQYKRNKAETSRDEVVNLSNSLKNRLTEAKKIVMEGTCLTVEEKIQLEEKLDGIEKDFSGISDRLADSIKKLSGDEYDNARTSFENSRLLLNTVADKLEKIVAFCQKSLANRESILKNEMYLKARLKKPYAFESGTELPEDLASLPKEFLQCVPKASDELSGGLVILELGPEFNNSFGANLVRSKPLLDHILETAKREPIKTKSRELFGRARDQYSQIKAKNDALPVWYRPSHDGTMSAEAIEDLKSRQETIINLIEAGDQAVTELENYYNFLHQQSCIYVWGHAYKEKRFSHTGTRPTINSKGELKLETYRYTTTGREFFMIKRVATPQGMSEDAIKVGEIDDPVAMWTFSPDQEVGYVMQWKPLHDDQIYTGTLESLKPIIEEEYPHLKNDPFAKK